MVSGYLFYKFQQNLFVTNTIENSMFLDENFSIFLIEQWGFKQ